VDYPVRARESYAEDLLETLDQDAIRARKYRIVVDYGYSAASLVLPVVLGALEVEAVAAHAFTATGGAAATANLRSLIGQAKKLVGAVGADFGVVFDRAGERLYLIDESGHEIPVEQALLLYLRLIGSNGKRGKLAFPVTVTSQVDQIVKGSGLEVIRTPASLSELTKAAAQDGVIFAGAIGGGYVFPDFLPAYDAMASLCKLLELLAPVEQPLSSLVAELPTSTLVHRQLPCPWSQKGTVMRVLTERLKGRDLDLLDGIKVKDPRGWAQVLPDPDEPLVHIYAEGRDERASNELEGELRQLVEEVLQEEAEISS
jgi:mannose-1-phosphate guanylyltransferase/phosphomannomutase